MNNPNTIPADEQKVRIRDLNDKLRKTLEGGQLFITPGIAALPADQYAAALSAVVTFENFTPDNDPRGEHDFGAIHIEDQSILWKIDYYDLSMQYLSPDPGDPIVTRRVLTIMLTHEY